MPSVVIAQIGNNRTSSMVEVELLEEQTRQIKMVVFGALVPMLVAFAFVTFVFYRRKREAFFRQTEAELKLSKAEVEFRALKAQINPHFIFNCMNSIHHFMHKNDIKMAGDYLIKFSQLIRLVLENSSLKTIPLNEEIRTLDLYIQLEQLRLEYKFSYEISIDKGIDKERYELPPSLIQPFVENAIWHELTQLREDAKLHIKIQKQMPRAGILCLIESSGIGRNGSFFSNELTNGIKKSSLGLHLIRERIELLNRFTADKAYFELKDISIPEKNWFGHVVELFIPQMET